MMRWVFAVLAALMMLASAGNAQAVILSNSAVVLRVDRFYEEMFSLSGKPYHAPTVHMLDEDEVYDGECGRVSGGTGFYAFYCPLDEAVVLDMPTLIGMNDEYGDVAFAVVVAHEWAHHIQNLSDVERLPSLGDPDWDQVYSIELELGADCLVGVFLAHLDDRDELASRDLGDAVRAIGGFGDEGSIVPIPRDSRSAHGTGAEREDALLRGYVDGVFGCAFVDPMGD